MVGFHGFDVATRLLEEFATHPSKLYTLLDQSFGISKIDPMETLGLYASMKQAIGAKEISIPVQPNVVVPTALPPPPALASGGQVAIGQVVPYRPKRPTPTFG
jgi:hypothetical protein